MLWLKNNKVVLDATGKVEQCADCPCAGNPCQGTVIGSNPPVTFTTPLNTWSLPWVGTMPGNNLIWDGETDVPLAAAATLWGCQGAFVNPPYQGMVLSRFALGFNPQSHFYPFVKYNPSSRVWSYRDDEGFYGPVGSTLTITMP
jgi:hypothetical protein